MKRASLLLGLAVLAACATGGIPADTGQRNPSDPAGAEAPVDPPSQTLQIPPATPDGGTPATPHQHNMACHHMHHRDQPSAQDAGVAPEGTVYTCPMHPEVESNEPGKCPKCGMTLVPKKKGAP